MADAATAAAGQPLALADRNAGREGLAATRSWHAKRDWGIVNPSVMAKGHDTSPKALRALGEALVGAFDGNTQAARPYGELGSTKQSSGPSGPAGPVPYHRATYHTKEFIP